MIYKKFNIGCPLQTSGNATTWVPDGSCTTKYFTINQEVSFTFLTQAAVSLRAVQASPIMSEPGTTFRRRTPSPSWPSPSCVILKFCPSTPNSAGQLTSVRGGPWLLKVEEGRLDVKCGLFWSLKSQQEKNAEHRQRVHPGNVHHVLLHSHIWIPDLLW